MEHRGRFGAGAPKSSLRAETGLNFGIQLPLFERSVRAYKRFCRPRDRRSSAPQPHLQRTTPCPRRAAPRRIQTKQQLQPDADAATR